MTRLAVLVLLLFTSPSQAALFMGLGDLPGGAFGSQGLAISPDGRYAVGASASLLGVGDEAYRWNLLTGMQPLGDLPGGTFASVAYGVSQNGLTVVGSGHGISPRQEAFRWTQGSGMIGLGTLTGHDRSHAKDISGNSSVTVGVSSNSGVPNSDRAFRWTQATGLVDIGLPGTATRAVAEAVSSDGSAIAGWSERPGGIFEAFRWTSTLGFQSIGDLPGGAFQSNATDISGDGSTVVGQSNSGDGPKAYRWTQADGIVALNGLSGGAMAWGTNWDGSVIVGDAGSKAFVWDQANGMRDLQDLLVNDYGLGSELTGWNLFSAKDVSADGRTITGTGFNPDGEPEAWVFSTGNQNVVPEPGSLLVWFGGIVLAGLWWIRRARTR